MLAPRELVNEFSWSKSRHGKFEECLRLYWFHYYGGWGGWEQTAAPEVREAYMLKNLSSRQQWAGHVVHQQIAFALSLARGGRPPPLEILLSRAHNQMRSDFVASRRGEYRSRPKWFVGLVEHEYSEPVTNEEWKANWDNAAACLRHFYAVWVDRARALRREDWLPIDEIDSFPLDGVKVFAGPDFAYRDGPGVVLVDWKTGRPRDEDRDQVQGYALYAQHKWGVAPEHVRARLAYLAQGTEVDVAVDPAALEGFRSLFRKSVEQMRSRLRDPAANLAVRDDFPMTDDRARCAGCAFRRPCGRQ